MGIDYKTFKFLEKNIVNKNIKKNYFGVLGRQHLNMSDQELKKINYKKNIREQYAENLLLKNFNLKKIDSYDINRYENATFIKDFNKKIYQKIKYDIFFDGGSLQHIYNIPQAIKNIINLTKLNGKIIHAVTFNNFQGFGLYQLSPEIFYQIYSKKNGFKNTEILIGSNLNKRLWYKIVKFKKRYNFFTNAQLSMYISTTKIHNRKINFIIQNFYKNLNKKNYTTRSFLFLYIKNILISIFPHLFLNFQKNLRKIEIR